MTVHDWCRENNCQWVSTALPPKDTRRLVLHVVEPLGKLREFEGPLGARINCSRDGDGGENIVVVPHPALLPYQQMPRFWRVKLFPTSFTRWTEQEHAQKRPVLTWQQQQAVWARMDAWEGFLDGQMSREQYETLMAGYEPLPSLGALWRTVAKAKTVRAAPSARQTPNFNEREWLAQRAKPVAAPNDIETTQPQREGVTV